MRDGDSLAGVFGIDGVGVVDVAEDGPGADMDHRLDAGKRRQRRDEDFIAGLEALGDMQEMHGGRPGTGEHDCLTPK